jgi:hypothetical protein
MRSGQRAPGITHLATDRHAAWAPMAAALLFSSEQEGTQAVFRAWLETDRSRACRRRPIAR